MKRLATICLTFILVACLSGEALSPAFAATSITKAKKAYSKAVAAEAKTKKTLDAASKPFNQGAYGFYKWVADNEIDWMKDDANEALKVLSESSLKNYTKKGNPDDATSLPNMKHAIGLFKTLAQVRKNDEYHPDLQPPTIRNVYMARAQVQANASSYDHEHLSDTKCDLGHDGLECLAWGCSNPFSVWYDKEKKNFVKYRNYVLKKYNIDFATDEFKNFKYSEKFDSDAYHKATASFGQIGHYKIVCHAGSTVLDYSDESSVIPYCYTDYANKVFFGIAYSAYGGCHSLEAVGDKYTGRYSDGYTVSEYTALFNQYYNSVYPKKELAAYNKAKKVSRSTLKALKKVATLKKKPTAKRKKKLVTVKWKKLSGVSGYQVSVAEKKGKTKVVATTGKKISSKKIKIKKSKRQYVKVRPFIVVDGKKVYGNWSKAVRTK